MSGEVISSYSSLPTIMFDAKEMEDVRWFSKIEVQAALTNRAQRSPDATAAPNATAAENFGQNQPALNFPGRSSLARLLIEDWCQET